MTSRSGERDLHTLDDRAKQRRLRRFMARGSVALFATAGLTGTYLTSAAPGDEGNDLVAVSTPSASASSHHDSGGGHHTDDVAASTEAPAPDALAAQLATAADVATRWPTAADALADGWTLATPYSSHVGAHYMRYDEVDGAFDVERPEMLLYGGDAPNSPFVGLAYYVLYQQPDGFAGPTDDWHQHPDVCIGPDGPVMGADGIGICGTGSQQRVGSLAWMLHAWVAPEWQSPQGVFSNENLALP